MQYQNTANTIKNDLTPFIFCEKDISNHVQAFAHGCFSFSWYKNFCLYCLRIVKLTAKPYRERIILFAYSVLVFAFVSLSAARLPSKHVRRESWYMRAHTHALSIADAPIQAMPSASGQGAIAFPYGKDFFICLLCQTYCETVPRKKYTFCHADTCASLSLNGGIFPQSDFVAVPILAPAYPLPSQKCKLPFAFASAFRLDLKDGFSLAVLPCLLSEFRFA